MVDAETQDDAVNTLDHLAVPSTGFPTKDHMAGANGVSVQHGEKDLVIGKCRTCDCAMKWPRQVDSYRCQICLMINDLKPSTSPLGEVFLAENATSAISKKRELHLLAVSLNAYIQTRSMFIARQHSKIDRRLPVFLSSIAPRLQL